MDKAEGTNGGDKKKVGLLLAWTQQTNYYTVFKVGLFNRKNNNLGLWG
jgi:hypothetical protein